MGRIIVDAGICPHCDEVLEIDDDQYGRGFECLACGGQITILRDKNSPQPENGNGNNNGQSEVIQRWVMILESDIHELRQFCEEKIPGARRMLRKLEAKLADLQKELQ